MTAKVEQTTSLYGWKLINDLSVLPENEDIIIDFLLERLQHGQIYTWVGSMLLTLNPNNEVSTTSLYSSSELDKYISMPDFTYEVNPHIFTVAAKAHNTLIQEHGRNFQVIIISGETGAGKTFNACKCLEFLSRINESSESQFQGDYTHNIMLRITDACRLISAFATACTEKNEVSSKHGQLVQLHYKGGTISGATINSFLLERSRVTKGSSNFQIFYQMIFGMSDMELKALNLSKYENYDILNVLDQSKRKYFEGTFQDTLKALEVLGFKVDQQNHIFEVLALVIHLGNIRFVKNGETCTIDLADKRSKEALKNTCTLSSLPEDVVTKLLTTILINPQSVQRKHSSYHRHLATIDACRNRLHSIIRHMYDLLFHYVLNYANNTLYVNHEYSKWLGILDIFGFESFEKNGMEQLCMNYANEKMQQYFIETHLAKIHKDLQEEGFIENSKPLHIINLYKQRIGVLEEALFLTLNDACQSPLTIDTPTIIKVACENSHNVQRKFLTAKEGNFIVQHYSGPVTYSIEDLLSKNTDKVPSEISVIFTTSKNKFIRSLFDIQGEEHLLTTKTSTNKRTMLAKVKYNIDALIKELSKCDLHYVRCVKPSRLGNHEWDRKDFRKQLACIGIFDALPLAKCKYPIHLHYKDFCQRYCKKPTEIVDLDKCKIILESVVSKKELDTSVHYGRQLIFLTNSVFFKLEFCRRNYHIKCANKIQTFWMKHRHKQIPAISKYTTTNNKIQKEYKNSKKVTPIKIELERELKQLNTSEEDDEVFITTTVSPKNNALTSNCIKNEVNNLNTKENLNEVCPGKNNPARQENFIKLQSDYENCQKEESKHWNECKNNINVNCKDENNNNNSLKHTEANNCLINLGLTENYKEETCFADYKTKRNLYTIQMDSYVLFYKNGILSRRQLSMVPIKIHTRPACLRNSHVLPRSELPRGLQDCL